MKNRVLTFLFLFFWVVLLPGTARGQLKNEYFAADQLLRQQKYEQAYEKFYRLHRQNPSTYIYLDKATECLINLKEYEKALALTQKAAEEQPYRAQAQIRLGEIHHISGNKQKAEILWNEVLKKYNKSQQIRLQLARTLSNRQVFDRAITVYEGIRKQFPNSNAITSELAGTYLQAGNYEQAIQEYLKLVKNAPERITFVQQRLIRFRDDHIYDVAILEISDFLKELPPDHPSYRQLQQLEVWLLTERNLYQRALVTAKNYENRSSQLTYILYSLGSKLLAAQKYELAEQAYSYYIDKNIYSVKFRSMEELATVYRQWAEHLENYNLGLSAQPKALYQKAYKTLSRILQQNPDYRRMGNILVALSELSLDVMHRPEAASEYLAKLRTISDSTLAPQTAYIDGRIHLYNSDYSRARISFAESRKKQRTGTLAERARYYSALTDFYSGDYEFAKIQLNALERQTTSNFANDAVQLRLWIQDGMRADSTGQLLDPFARAVEHFSRGKNQLGSNALQDLLNNGQPNPLADDAVLELSRHKNRDNIVYVYRTLSKYLSEYGSSSPLHERLLWEKARIADQLVTNKNMESTLAQFSADTTTAEKKALRGDRNRREGVYIPRNREEVIALYEKILLNFPDGFYTSYARERIEELQNIQS